MIQFVRKECCKLAHITTKEGFYHDVAHFTRYEFPFAEMDYDRTHSEYQRTSYTDLRLFPGPPRENSTNKLVKLAYDMNELIYGTKFLENNFEKWDIGNVDKDVLFMVENMVKYQRDKGFRHEVVLSIPNYSNQDSEDFPKSLHSNLSPKPKREEFDRFEKNIDLEYTVEVIPPKLLGL